MAAQNLASKLAALLLLSSAIVLAGCQIDANLVISGSIDRPAAVVTYRDNSPACIRGMWVWALDAAKPRLVWAVNKSDARDEATCVNALVIGSSAPKGYALSASALSLRRGVRYRINASGVGWNQEEEWVAK
jgi:hypothetical protein